MNVHPAAELFLDVGFRAETVCQRQTRFMRPATCCVDTVEGNEITGSGRQLEARHAICGLG